MKTASNQTGLTLEEIAWNYTLQQGNMRYNADDQFCYDIYTKQRIGDARWVQPATLAVAEVLRKALVKKYGNTDIPVFSPEGVMDKIGLNSDRAVDKFHKRLHKAVDKYRPRD